MSPPNRAGDDGPGDRISDRRVFRWLAWVFMAATAITLLPLWLPMLLAAWFAHLARPLVDRLTRAFGGRSQVASLIVVLALLLILVPLSFILVQLIGSAVTFARKIMASPEWRI